MITLLAIVCMVTGIIVGDNKGLAWRASGGALILIAIAILKLW